jgi:hypothetical protein
MNNYGTIINESGGSIDENIEKPRYDFMAQEYVATLKEYVTTTRQEGGPFADNPDLNWRKVQRSTVSMLSTPGLLARSGAPLSSRNSSCAYE